MYVVQYIVTCIIGDVLHSLIINVDPILQDLETVRFWIDASLTARDVAETYLPPFIGCAAAAGSAAVMTTYYAIQLLPNQSSVSISCVALCAAFW